MGNSNKDIFETTKKNFFVNSENLNSSNNFFMKDAEDFVTSTIQNETSGKLNDYDFNLLKENAYKDIGDDLLKLEYKISKTEDEIKKLDLQIQAANDIDDFAEVEKLRARKVSMTEEYEALIAIYDNKSLSAKITNSITDFYDKTVGKKLNAIENSIAKISEKFIDKLPKRFATIITIKKSLEKLENINKSVDDLVTMNIPYGENRDKYRQLSGYIIKANSIQSEISKLIK